MQERRQCPRLDKKIGITYQLFDVSNKIIVTNAVDASTVNVSREGMALVLPRGWDCPECNNCLGWSYNLRCKLKNGHTPDVSHVPSEKLHLKIFISSGALGNDNPIELEGECVWLSQSKDPRVEYYNVGISLTLSGPPEKNNCLVCYQEALSRL